MISRMEETGLDQLSSLVGSQSIARWLLLVGLSVVCRRGLLSSMQVLRNLISQYAAQVEPMGQGEKGGDE